MKDPASGLDTLENTFATRARRAGPRGDGALLQLVEGPDPRGDFPFPANGLTVGTGAGCSPRLTDKRVSRSHVHIQPAEHGFRVRDLGSTNGTFLDGTRLEDAWVPSGAVIRIGRTSLRLLPSLPPRPSETSARSSFGELVGTTPAMRQVFALLERLAGASASVLIQGETGTGKELVAAALHAQGPRRDRPLVVVDCGAISASLIESELFGHVRGAFTGAHEARAGAFERAHGGVVFLDEIGELPLELQPKLLRALESREVRRVGGSAVQRIDVQVLAATHRDLAEMVDEGGFRADLYFRLAVVPVELPPLRERREDLPILVERLLRNLGASGVGPIDGHNLERLAAHDWPGNVRELRNVLARALAAAGTGVVRFADLSLHLGAERITALGRAAPVDISVPFFTAKERMNDAFEASYLRALLADCQGNVALASRRAGIARRHLYDLLKKHGLRG